MKRHEYAFRMNRYIGLFFVIWLNFFISNSAIAKPINESNDWDKWVTEDLEEKALQVNEGNLNFIASPLKPTKIHSLFNTITITPRSVETHWVDFRQCHKNLDRVAQSQVVYQYKQMRKLKIEFFKGIGKAWVEGQSIQLQDVMDDAEFCAVARVKILIPQGNNKFLLRNGPFYRKFLDGYYPFHVQLLIKYPQTLLKIQKVLPQAQAGFAVKPLHNELHIDAWFEGELTIEVFFSALQ